MISLLFSLLVSTSHAACDKPVTALQEGQAAPCTGYLFTPEKELEVRFKTNTYDKLTELTKKQDEMIDVLNLRIDNNQKQISLYEQKIQQNQSTEFYQKLLYFGLGVLTTTVIANTVIHNVGR